MQKYRPDIDGLRAIAVIAVIAYHAFLREAPGGFVGVDIFFVISGYFISGILMKSANTGGIRFFDFYRRRINRIFPSLTLVLFFCLGLGWVSLFPNEFHQLGADVVSGATFSENFSLMGEAGYFDRSADTKPLLHLWSLAIEEQFYILWPLLIWGIQRLRGRWLTWLGVFSLLSFGANLLVVLHDRTTDFYLPLTRFWELSLGGMLAAYELERPALKLRPLPSRIISIAGAVMPAIALFTFSSDHFPGAKALIPVLGTIALIGAGASANINRFFLANPVLRWVGSISYPLYLWHWPLLAFARILEGKTPSVLMRVEILLLTLLLATLTHYFIENPCRFGKYPIRKMSLALATMFLAVVLGQCIFLRFLHGHLMYGYTDHPSDYASGIVGRRINLTLLRYFQKHTAAKTS